MPDYPDIFADKSWWKALPIPASAGKLQCQIQPVRVTFKADPNATDGFIVQVGGEVEIAAGAVGYLRPHVALGGKVVFEAFGASTDFTPPGPDPIMPAASTITVTGGTITPFSRDGEDYIEIAMPAGNGSVDVSAPVAARWVLSGSGASGAVSTSTSITPGGSAGALPVGGSGTLPAGLHSFAVAPGADGRRGQGPGVPGLASSWTLPDGTNRQSFGGGYGGGYAPSGVDANKYVGGTGANAGGGMCGSSAAYAGGTSNADGFAGGAGFYDATAANKAGGGAGGAGEAGAAGTSGTGGDGGDGIYLDWIADPRWVCGGGAGCGGTAHGAPGRGGASASQSSGTSLAGRDGGASGSVLAGTASGPGGDGFAILVVRATDARVIHAPMADANFSRVSYWGSSSAQHSGSAFITMVAGLGATGLAEGKASERFEETGARIGSHPWSLRFPDNTIPASGSAAVTVAGAIPPGTSALKAFAGRVGGISGSLSWDGASLMFTRAEAGDPLILPGDTAFVPALSDAARRSPIVLWLAKNNLTSSITPNSAEYAAQVHEEVADWLLPAIKRVIVIGQFRNTGWAADHAAGLRVDACNELLSAMFREAYVDVVAWMRDDATWARLGLTKTTADIAELALGNLPPSLAAGGGTDPQHFSAAAYADLINNVLRPRMIELGWFAG